MEHEVTDDPHQDHAILVRYSWPALGDERPKSKVVIKQLSGTGAAGKVVSKRASCEGGKKVTLFRLDDFISVKIEITQSDSNGGWATRQDLQPGTYFAKVDASDGCRYAVSRFKKLR